MFVKFSFGVMRSNAWLWYDDFYQADLARADFSGNNLYNIYFEETNLAQANFAKAKIKSVVFFRANLSQASFTQADLRDVELVSADLHEANFDNAQLYKVDYFKANLRGANFAYANSWLVNFSGADLRGTNFSFSTWPLWCGTFHLGKTGERLLSQMVRHTREVARVCDSRFGEAVDNALEKFDTFDEKYRKDILSMGSRGNRSNERKTDRRRKHMPSVEEIRQSCELGESQPGYQIYIREDIKELLKEIDRQAGLIEQQDRQIIKLHALLVTINNITAEVVL